MTKKELRIAVIVYNLHPSILDKLLEVLEKKE
jgi:hypothetical protein